MHIYKYVDIPPQLAGEKAGRLYLARSPGEYDELKEQGRCVVPVTEDACSCTWADGGAQIDCEAKESPFIIANPGELSVEDYIPIYRRLMGLPLVILETERTLIREFCPEDCKNPSFCALESLREDEDYVRDYCKYVYGFYNYGIWLITDKVTYDIIGCAGLKTEKVNDDEENQIKTYAVKVGNGSKSTESEEVRRGETHLREAILDGEIPGRERIDSEGCNEDSPGSEAPFLGYEILPEYRSLGYATEACRGILEYAAGSLGFDRVYARIKADNHRSLMVAKSLGFQYTTFQLFS